MIAIVTPALASANNGNWQTAWRWSRMLSSSYRTQILGRWSGEPADLLIALHARRSAASIATWSTQRPQAPLAVVLTGTDLYRDIETDSSAQQSLQLADRLVVLQDLGARSLPAPLRRKTRVIFQSTPARQTLTKTARHLRCVMVGHLRSEKSPETYFAVAQKLAARHDILLDHIGAPLDAKLGREAEKLTRTYPHYRWLGGLDHEATRRHIQRAHLLVHCSRMEGGAHVVMEALQCGTPVIASRIDGNVGMLGRDYRGYFPWGDAQALTTLLTNCRESQSQRTGGLLNQLAQQAVARAPLFDPANERNALLALVGELLAAPR